MKIGTTLVALAALAVGAGWMAAWPSKAQDKAPPQQDSRPIPVETALVVLKDVPIEVDAVGTIQANATVTVKARVDGQLTDVAFREGQEVKAGEILARIDSRTYRAQVDQARATRDRDAAQLAVARKDLERYQALQTGAVSAQTLDAQRATVQQLEATVRADQAALDNAQVMLDYTTITAPISGRAGLRQVDQGNMIRTSDNNGLVVITQVQPISVMFTLPQQSLPTLTRRLSHDGHLQLAVLAPDSGKVLDKGEVSMIDNQVDSSTGTLKLKGTLPNERLSLWPGAFVTVRLQLDIKADALVVPQVAVQRGPNGPYVFVVKPDNSIEQRPVTLGPAQRDQALIETGVEAGEVVVVEGQARLRAGSKVALGQRSESGKKRKDGQ